MSETKATEPSSAPASNITSRIVSVPANASGTRIDMMLDIETLSTDPDALVLSVGAVLFDPFGEPGTYFDSFHKPLRLDQSGSKTSLDTVLWWMSQSEAGKAMTQLRQDVLPVPATAIRALIDRLMTPVRASRGKVWANGPAFDCVILKNLFDREGLETPWDFWNERCYRTLKGEFGHRVALPQNLNAHDALADAQQQAIGVQLIMRSLNEVNVPA